MLIRWSEGVQLHSQLKAQAIMVILGSQALNEILEESSSIGVMAKELPTVGYLQCCQLKNHQTAAQVPQHSPISGKPIEITLTVIGSANRGTQFFVRGTWVKSSPILRFSRGVGNTGYLQIPGNTMLYYNASGIILSELGILVAN